jgi:hypothetical protein
MWKKHFTLTSTTPFHSHFTSHKTISTATTLQKHISKKPLSKTHPYFIFSHKTTLQKHINNNNYFNSNFTLSRNHINNNSSLSISSLSIESDNVVVFYLSFWCSDLSPSPSNLLLLMIDDVVYFVWICVFDDW